MPEAENGGGITGAFHHAPPRGRGLHGITIGTHRNFRIAGLQRRMDQIPCRKRISTFFAEPHSHVIRRMAGR